MRGLDFGKILDFCQTLNHPMHCQSDFSKFQVKWGLFLLPMECQLTTNWMSIDSQWNINWFQTKYKLTSNFMSIHRQLTDNWRPIDFQLEGHFVGPSLYSTEFISGLAPRLFASIEGNAWGADPEMNSVNANGIPEKRQLIANAMPTDIQLDYNWQLKASWLSIEESFCKTLSL